MTMERVMGIEPTHSAWKADALPLSHTRISEAVFKNDGAGDGNRTHIAGLGSRCSTTELHPRLAAAPLVKRAFPPASDGNDILPMERKTRFELATFALARRRSTTEPLPLVLNPCPPVGQKEQASATAMLRSVRTKRATGRLATWCGRKDSNLHAWGTRT